MVETNIASSAVVAVTASEQQEIGRTTSTGQLAQESSARDVLVLRLVPARKKKEKAVKWADDVIDNEFMGRKSSKRCCIFHRQRQFGDWSDGDSDVECEECDRENYPGPSQPKSE